MQKVYVVEDAPLVRERLIEMLDATPGTQVIGAAEGAAEAIRGILEERPDVVLLDLRLAQGNGLDVLRAVHPAAPEITFYMLTSFATEPYRQLAVRLGAQDFFDKASDFERMRDIIAARSATKH
jgi:DNA-binding NarL/FixJ family response regulator